MENSYGTKELLKVMRRLKHNEELYVLLEDVVGKHPALKATDEAYREIHNDMKDILIEMISDDEINIYDLSLYIVKNF